MNTLILEPTQQALWHRVLRDAAATAGQSLDDTLEAYLLMLLLRFTRKPELLRTIMAREYLEGMQHSGRVRDERLRDVGDQCLLLAGLFPGLAQRRRVSAVYFIDLGRGAYGELAGRLAQSAAQLYRELALGFGALLDVLHALRGSTALEALSPLECWELWGKTGSRAARTALAGARDALPVFTAAPGRH
ncbi:hypothetical protein [Acidihalobacter ferrooxydans]|uniref:Uncharacterized protein n=1 Tax=Acidihalobacter ferrooxydans TaxID=1765967 RepID=A0A1P8UDW7_9GAMM|nr:hypothetical protein [Acidihalobacter ferrooxydans]APZ41954.1 hypothetical protein BW247_01610 [Acidihalobacter ferrooxydans]